MKKGKKISGNSQNSSDWQAKVDSMSPGMKKAAQLRFLEQQISFAISQLHKQYNWQGLDIAALKKRLEDSAQSLDRKSNRQAPSYLRRLRWREGINLLRERLIYSEWAAVRWSGLAALFIAAAFLFFSLHRPDWRQELNLAALFTGEPAEEKRVNNDTQPPVDPSSTESVSKPPEKGKGEFSSARKTDKPSKPGKLNRLEEQKEAQLSLGSKEQQRVKEGVGLSENDKTNPARRLGRPTLDKPTSEGIDPQPTDQPPREVALRNRSMERDTGNLENESEKGKEERRQTEKSEEQLKQAVREAESPAEKLEALQQLKRYYELRGEIAKQKAVELDIKRHKILNP